MIDHAKRLAPLEVAQAGELVLHEIYASIQGESTFAGLPCTFVRTTACDLRCVYCDTPHAFTQGKPWSLDAVLEEVRRLEIPLVEITGGEPLLQSAVLTLMTRLCDEDFDVLLETSGSQDIGPVDPRVVRIMDIKTPDSGEESANRWENIDLLTAKDQVKLVLGSRGDYAWARRVIQEYRLLERCDVLMGVVWGAVEPRDLAAWVVEDRLGVRMQLQMHKYVWDPKARGV